MGETSVLACLIGAVLLMFFGLGSWRSMVAMGIGAFGTAWALQYGAEHFGDAAYNPAKYAFPAYKHLLLGGMAFGVVFMLTDPVSSPAMNSAKWCYGLLAGFMVVVIRAINPAYPEGVMLAILFANVFAPLFDYYAMRRYRRNCHVRTAIA